VGPTPKELTGERSVTLDLTFLAAASPRRALLVHQGTLPRADELPGAAWALALRDGRVHVDDFAHGRAWQSGRLRSPWQRLLVFLDVTPNGDLAPGRAELVGGERATRGLRAVSPIAWDDVHGVLPPASGLVVGGLRDLAGGHTNLRYGERRGEIIARLALWEGRPSEATTPPASSVGGSVTVGVTRDDAGVRFVCRGVRPGDEVVWDFEDEIVHGVGVLRPRALVRSAPRVYVIAGGSTPVRVAVPRSLPGARPVPVFRPGDGGYAGFRIPAIVGVPGGALLAFAEGRRESVSDSCRTKDLVVRRSDDGGRHWGPLCVAAAAPNNHGARSLMNPSPVVDTVHGTGRVVLVASLLEASEWQIAAGAGRGRLQAWTSDDHGSTWSEGRDVVAPDAFPSGLAEAWPGATGWRLQVGTLGHGVQLRRGPHRGRLCFVGHGTFGPASVFDALGFLFWSDDLGATWQLGPAITHRDDGRVARGWNEGTLAELHDGSLILNARQYVDGRPAGRRAVARVLWDRDGAARPSAVRDDVALVDSAVQASLLATEAGRRLAFCNPAHRTARIRLTLRESDDGGATWPRARLLVAGPSGYSDLAPLPGGGLGVLYEAGHDGHVAFLRVPEWEPR
jgi:sialidase-1